MAVKSETKPDVTPATAGTTPISHSSVAADFDRSGAADISPASEFSPSGAARQVTDIDIGHPAVDNDPRAGTTVNQNRIDFNDPLRSGSEIVEDMLKDQAKA